MGEHRLTQALRDLLLSRRTAALGTLSGDGEVFVSMVPFAVDADTQTLVIHVSALAAHTANMQRNPRVSLMVSAAEVPGEPVHALPRVTLDGSASTVDPASPSLQKARQAYLARFPEAAPMTELGDFRFVRLHLLGARQIAGFGAARSLTADEARWALGACAP